jgi:hypothetical protein
MHFKKWQKHWEWCMHTEGPTSRMAVASKPKVSFNQMAAPVTKIKDEHDI